MVEKVKGLVGRIKAEGKAEGVVEGKKDIINRILDVYSLKETAKLLRMNESEIIHIINK